MFSLSICMGSVVWAFRFKTEEAAQACYDEACSPVPNPLHIVDDYGQSAIFDRVNIHGVLLEDMKKSREAHIEQMLHNSSMQQEAQKRANTRPQSPSIVSPFGRPQS